MGVGVAALIGVVVAGLVSLTVGRGMIAIGPRLGFVDLPDDHLKIHSTAAVPLGGAGVFVGVHLGAYTAGIYRVDVAVATGIVWLLGLVDDRRGLSPIVRLATEAIAGVALALAGSLASSPVHLAAIVIIVLVLVNAVNLIDGLDGLAGSVSLVGLVGLATLGAVRDVEGAAFGLVAAAAVAGFLAWNRPPARLFLGDNGAYLLGVVLAFVAVSISSTPVELIVAMGLIGFPLLDLFVTIARRAGSHRPLMSGDRDHVYDRLAGEEGAPGAVKIIAAGQVVWTVFLIGAEMVVGTWGAVLVAAVMFLAGATWLVRKPLEAR